MPTSFCKIIQEEYIPKKGHDENTSREVGSGLSRFKRRAWSCRTAVDLPLNIGNVWITDL